MAEDILTLKAEGLVKRYRRRTVVRGVNLTLRTGEVVGLLGPNGAGKTTTFYMIMGVIRPNAGRILLGEEEITRWPMYQRARAGMGYLPQEPSIFRKLSVYENVYGILEFRGIPRQEAHRRTEEALEKMGILHLRDQPAGSLSGGERRRLEIARSLALQPRFLLLDEPFTGIDPKTRQEIQDIIQSLKEMNIGILITDHNVRETLQITDRASIIYQGEIFLEGTVETLLQDPRLKEIYLGERFTL